MQRGPEVSRHTMGAMDIAIPPLVSDLRQCAILLDIDGTILDIAPSPRQVWVPTGLRRTLSRLADLTGGAVALVSGRSINDIDLIFSPLQLPTIGVHGAESAPIAGGGGLGSDTHCRWWASHRPPVPALRFNLFSVHMLL